MFWTGWFVIVFGRGEFRQIRPYVDVANIGNATMGSGLCDKPIWCFCFRILLFRLRITRSKSTESVDEVCFIVR